MSFLDQYQFADGWVLWFLFIVPIAILAYIYISSRNNGTMATSDISTLDGIDGGSLPLLKHINFGLKMLGLGSLIVGLARPQVSMESESFIEHYKEGIDIVVAMDLSGSMLAEDFQPNRYEASVEVAKDFIGKRENDRIGIVAFQGQSYTQCPLTSDTKVALELLDEMERDVVQDGTAIGMGLATSVNRLRESKSKSKVVILLTDGVNRDGEIHPLTAAEMAQEYNIRVYTIGVGSNGTAPFPTLDPFGRKIHQQIPVEIDEDILKEISRMTKGKYFRATNEEALANIYAEIDMLEKEKIKSIEYEVDLPEKMLPFLLLGFALVFFSTILNHTIFKSIS